MTYAADTSAMRWALFLDVDGTLLQLAATPEQVVVPDRLTSLLATLSQRIDGAIALISGRTIQNLDELFAPLTLCAAGIHGAERRDASGPIERAEIDTSALRRAHAELLSLVEMREGLLLEDKGAALALHYRLAPHLQDEVFSRIASVVDRLGPQFTLQTGKCVYEIRPSAWTKGSAVHEFMTRPPFQGRVPIYLGDDATDEHGFAAVNALNGMSIRVGRSASTCARYSLRNVSAVHDWLATLPAMQPLIPIKRSSQSAGVS